jgi:hypothetical protein
MDIKAQMLSQDYKDYKISSKPFIKRQLIDQKHNTQSEQNLYKWIYENWFYCYPQHTYNHKTNQVTLDFIGYQILYIKNAP